jgi:preprotein translocase subunit SecE
MAQNAENAPATGAAPVQRKGNFLEEVIIELKKTTWPTWPEAWRLTVVVLAVIITVGIYVGIIDFLLTYITAKTNLIK